MEELTQALTTMMSDSHSEEENIEVQNMSIDIQQNTSNIVMTVNTSAETPMSIADTSAEVLIGPMITRNDLYTTVRMSQDPGGTDTPGCDVPYEEIHRVEGDTRGEGIRHLKERIQKESTTSVDRLLEKNTDRMDRIRSRSPITSEERRYQPSSSGISTGVMLAPANLFDMMQNTNGFLGDQRKSVVSTSIVSSSRNIFTTSSSIGATTNGLTTLSSSSYQPSCYNNNNNTQICLVSAMVQRQIQAARRG
jgi:hypothetical protein